MKQSKLFDIGMCVVAIIQFALMTIHEWVYYYSYMHSDIAADLYMADSMAKSGEWIFCQDWVPSSEIHFLHTQLFMRPLFTFLQDYRVVMTLSFIIGTLSCCIVCFWVTYELCHKIGMAALSVCLLLVPVGELYVYGFRALASWPYMFFTLLFWGLYLRWRKNKKPYIWGGILVLSVLMAMCGIRFFTCVFIPLIGMYIWNFVKRNFESNHIRIEKEYLLEVGSILAAVIIGYGVFSIVIAEKYGGGSAAGAVLVSGMEVLENFIYIPIAMLECFGGFIIQNRVISTHGIAQLVIMAGAAVVLFLWGYSYRNDINETDDEKMFRTRQFLAIALLSNFAMIGLTDMGQIWGRYMESHYLVLAMILLFPFICAVLAKCKMNGMFRMGIIGLLLLYMLAGDAYAFRRGQSVEEPAYISWLEESGYEYGWATDYWKSTITTAYTDGEIVVCNVRMPEFSNRGTQLTLKSNYDRSPEFIILSDKTEYEEIKEIGLMELTEVYFDDDVLICIIK